MSARTPSGATEAHRHQIQRSVSCVTNEVITIRPYYVLRPRTRGEHHTLVLGSGQPVRLPTSDHVSLQAAQRIEVHQSATAGNRSWTVSVTEYFYAVALHNGTEIVAYHWHLDSPGDVTEPHLHIGPAATRLDSVVRPREMHKVHFPTGQVTLEQVIRLAITEFDVTPRRADWEAVLSEPDG